MKIIVALVGKAGSGKDRIQHELCKAHPEYHSVIHCTTRPMRENEQDGVNYYFLTETEFIESILNRDLLEVTEFRKWFYGTLKSSLQDGVNIGVFNPEAYYNLTSCVEEDVIVLGFYILCKDKTRLLRQLNREENPDVKEIVRRFGTDENDFIDIDKDNRLVRVSNEFPDDIQNIVMTIECALQHLDKQV